MSPARRRRVAVSAAVVAALGGSALVAGAAACSEAGRVVDRPDGWVEVRPPGFDDSSGVTDVRSYAVAAADPRILYVTNGSTILGSDDGGCSWETVYHVNQVSVGQLVTSPARQIVAIDVPRRQSGRLYVLLAESGVATTTPEVVVIEGEEHAARESVAGLPVAGVPGRLALSLRADTAYVTVDGAVGGRASEVYATEDGGRRWSRRGALPAPATALVVDPRASSRLWVVADGLLHRSDDGGTTFRPVGQTPERVSDVAAGLTATNTRLVAPQAGREAAYHSDDDGYTWTTLSSATPATSAAVADELPLTALAGERSVRVVTAGYAEDISPERLTLDDLTFTGLRPDGLFLFGRTGRMLLRQRFSPVGLPVVPRVPVVKGVPPEVDIGDVDAPKAGGATLAPAETTLTLSPGESRTVGYTLTLPPVPTPLDVVFLVDTTGSMQDAIDGLRSGIGDIVRSLAGSGIDARFALVDFRDYAVAPWGGPGDFPYQRLRDLGPADDELEDAIEQLDAWGGGDEPESSLPALFQTATGRGQTLNGVTVVAPGEGISFRPGSLRVAVMVTDAPHHGDEAGYPGPSYDETVQALRAKQIHQVGLAVSSSARDDLNALARATGAHAPPGGTDCDDDGSADVPAGQPLVCDGTGPGLAPAIVGMLRGVRDQADVAAERTGADVLTVLTPPARVNVREAQRLSYGVRVACRPEHYGETHRGGVRAVSRGRVLAAAGVTVICTAPVRVYAYVPQERRPPAAAAVVGPPPPPPQPITNPNPNPQPNGQGAPQANVQAQPGTALQEQERAQLALAHAESGADWEMAMSSRHRETDPALAWAAAGLLAAAAGAAARRRHSLAR